MPSELMSKRRDIRQATFISICSLLEETQLVDVTLEAQHDTGTSFAIHLREKKRKSMASDAGESLGVMFTKRLTSNMRTTNAFRVFFAGRSFVLAPGAGVMTSECLYSS